MDIKISKRGREFLKRIAGQHSMPSVPEIIKEQNRIKMDKQLTPEETAETILSRRSFSHGRREVILLFEDAVNGAKEYASQQTAALQSRVVELERWKREQIEVLHNLDLQTVGQEIGSQLGSDVSWQVLPAIRNYKSKIDQLERESSEIRNAHETIRRQSSEEIFENKQHAEKLMELLEKEFKAKQRAWYLRITVDSPGVTARIHEEWQSYKREHGLQSPENK